MALGLLRRDQLVLSAASGEGNRAVLLGSSTGRDGIGGASLLASSGFAEGAEGKRPSVQIGDPFEEKRLIEACLELYRRGLVVGIQDLGAAGISCATAESAAKGRMGMDVDLDAVHLREEGMTAAEILMSESQERMLAIVRPEDLAEVEALATKWEIAASPIGIVTAGGTLRVRHRGEIVAEVPAASLSEGAPRYERPRRRPDDLDEVWADQPSATRLGRCRRRARGVALRPRRRGPVAGVPAVRPPAVPRHRGGAGPRRHRCSASRARRRGLAVSTDGDGARCALDARRGAARIVWEAALNVAVTGARPYAVVDNLNLGNPERPEVMWQLVETVAGLSAACEALGIPVVGGNVSFYNETDGADIPPTPVVGMLGLADPMPTPPPPRPRRRGHGALASGSPPGRGLAASCLEKVLFGHGGGSPTAPDPTGPAPWWRGEDGWLTPGLPPCSTTSPLEGWRSPWPR